MGVDYIISSIVYNDVNKFRQHSNTIINNHFTFNKKHHSHPKKKAAESIKEGSISLLHSSKSHFAPFIFNLAVNVIFSFIFHSIKGHLAYFQETT